MTAPYCSSSPSLNVGCAGKVWTLTLNRPDKRNALSADLVEALIAAVQAAERAQADLLILRGEGRNFSAGFDFSDYEQQSEGDLVLRFVRIETLLQMLAHTPCATLALAHGQNFGAGVDLIAVCRQRVASADARFRMPGLQFGLALGTGRLAALIGGQQAHQLLAGSQIFDAAKAEQLGFINGIQEPDAWPAVIEQAQQTAGLLDATSRTYLHQLTGCPQQADRDMAALVRSASAPGLKQRIAAFRQAAKS
ncbi:enoyl-CoA hydratase [Alcaligenes faecalis]|uniref:enoyl-CoA hydratase/isomerase family protein n=1 Tax=Alcaligenes faecalis TaxID=511 RepID=UPI001933616B|nr:enoyl-CoA hydratase/isomerase family protein [Alcaligenes faecalis]QRF89480.1 enoyl-CoA hydratase [Alcaligenes faecalis]